MKSLIICACEKVIVDKTSGANSLIGLMRSANVQTPNAPPNGIPSLPSNAVVPSTWYIYTMWQSEARDAGIEFDQVIEIYWPNGELFATNRLKFTAEESLTAQNANGFVGFPAGQVGTIKIRCWIERDGQPVSEIVHYEVTVIHDLPS